MRIDDFARPENLIRGVVKLFVVILALLLLPALFEVLVKALPGLAVIAGLALASFAAHAARERERARPRRPQQAGGAERTPVLPTIEEDF